MSVLHCGHTDYFRVPFTASARSSRCSDDDSFTVQSMYTDRISSSPFVKCTVITSFNLPGKFGNNTVVVLWKKPSKMSQTVLGIATIRSSPHDRHQMLSSRS